MIQNRTQMLRAILERNKPTPLYKTEKPRVADTVLRDYKKVPMVKSHGRPTMDKSVMRIGSYESGEYEKRAIGEYHYRDAELIKQILSASVPMESSHLHDVAVEHEDMPAHEEPASLEPSQATFGDFDIAPPNSQVRPARPSEASEEETAAPSTPAPASSGGAGEDAEFHSPPAPMSSEKTARVPQGAGLKPFGSQLRVTKYNSGGDTLSDENGHIYSMRMSPDKKAHLKSLAEKHKDDKTIAAMIQKRTK